MEDKDLNQAPGRFEAPEQKENKFVALLKAFGRYLKGVGFDFIQSFKYNEMKLAGWLIAIPGLLIGFFLQYHYTVVNELTFSYKDYVGFSYETITFLDFDFSGLVLLVLMLAGILNVFQSTTLMKNKNLGSVITCTVFGAIMAICAGLYLFVIFYYKSLCDSGEMPRTCVINKDYIISIASVISCVVVTIVGIILAFINYDRTYEKVDR